MAEELDRREFLAIASASGIAAVAGFSTTFPVDEGVEVPEGQVGGPGGGGFAMADEFQGSILRLESGESFGDVEPDTDYALVFSTDMTDFRVHSP